MSDYVGANQAAAMLRRVSPEGRLRAAHARRRRLRRTVRAGGLLILFLAAAILALAASAMFSGSLSAAVIAGALVLALLAWVGTLYLNRERRVAPEQLSAAPLRSLPGATAAWLEGAAPALPAPAVGSVERITGRLPDLGLQLEGLDERQPAADAVRRLLAVELPNLIQRYQTVPSSSRAVAGERGRSADDHLAGGLAIVANELDRMIAQLAGGDMDALATQDRFLELKYQSDEILKP